MINNKKILQHLFNILETTDNLNTRNSEEIKCYSILKTALELNIPKDMVEHAVECYRRGEIKV